VQWKEGVALHFDLTPEAQSPRMTSKATPALSLFSLPRDAACFNLSSKTPSFCQCQAAACLNACLRATNITNIHLTFSPKPWRSEPMSGMLNIPVLEVQRSLCGSTSVLEYYAIREFFHCTVRFCDFDSDVGGSSLSMDQSITSTPLRPENSL
jgi:hypothetical protein